MDEIVVGVDGSEHCREALRWALREAKAHGSKVVALYAYDYTPAWSVYAYGEGMVAPPAPSEEEIEEAARDAERHAEALLGRMLTELGDDAVGVDVERLAVADRRPAHALVERAERADLLVVGSRGRGGFMGLVLGSVSNQCAQHAPCPVVIVRAPEEDSP
jgi:nucleotide-binding universal stress UspA family protein